MSPIDAPDLDKPSLESELEKLRNIIEQFKDKGVSVEAGEAMLDEAESALNEGNLKMAKTLIDKAGKTAQLIRQQYYIQTSSILFSSLKRIILSLEDGSAEENQLKELYNEAMVKFDEGNFEEAIEIIQNAKTMAQDITSIDQTDALEDFKAVAVVPKKGKDAQTSATMETIEAPGGDFEPEDKENKVEMESVSKILIRVDKLLKEARSAGYTVIEVEKWLSLAEDAFDYQDFKTAKEYALKCEVTLKENLKPLHEEQAMSKDEDSKDIKDKAQEILLREDVPVIEELQEIDSKFSDMVPKGIVGDAPEVSDEEYLIKAQDAVLRRGKKIAKKGKKRSKSKAAAVDAAIKEDERAQADLLEHEAAGETVHEDFTDELQDILQEDFTDELKDVLDEATKDELEDQLETKEVFDNDAVNLLIYFEKKISIAKELGLQVAMAERLYLIAESYFDRGQFDVVKDYVEKGVKNINDAAMRRGISEELESKLDDKDIKEISIKPGTPPVPKVQDKKQKIPPKTKGPVKPAEPTKTPKLQESTEKVPKISTEAPPPKVVKPKVTSEPTPKASAKPGMSAKPVPEPAEPEDEIEQMRKLKKLRATLLNLQGELSEYMEAGIQVEDANELLQKAYQELESNQFVKANKLKIELNKRINEIKKNYIKEKALNLVKLAWQELTKIGMETPNTVKANKLITDARNNIKKGNYKKAAEFAVESLQLIKANMGE